MTKQTDFDTWWEARYFYTEGNHHKPLYSCLKKLYEGGAALYQIQEIDTLGGCLIIGDMWATDIDDNNSLIRRKRSHHAMRSFASLHPKESILKAEIELLKAEIEELKAEKEGYQKLLLDTVRAGEKEITGDGPTLSVITIHASIAGISCAGANTARAFTEWRKEARLMGIVLSVRSDRVHETRVWPTRATGWLITYCEHTEPSRLFL